MFNLVNAMSDSLVQLVLVIVLGLIFMGIVRKQFQLEACGIS
jgi:hypothetical protein